jgi:hypothetical protein
MYSSMDLWLSPKNQRHGYEASENVGHTVLPSACQTAEATTSQLKVLYIFVSSVDEIVASKVVVA